MDKPSDALFNIPDFFVNRTALDDAVKSGGIARISIKDVASDRQIKKYLMICLVNKKILCKL